MNLVDLVILVACLGAALHGFFRGAAVQLCSFIGFWGGLIIGALLAPLLTAHLHSTVTKTVAAIVVVFGLAIVLGAVGERLGSIIRKSLRVMLLGPIDSGLGSVIGVIATLLAVWLVSAMLLAIGNVRSVAKPVSQSVIVRSLQRDLPPAPSVFAQVGHFLTPTGLPAIFANVEAAVPVPLPVPSGPVVAAAVAAAGPSTVKVQGYGCGGIKSGSGFIVAPGIVVTNAHVVSGISLPEVYTSNGHRYADTTVVLFDPEVDIAVLRVSGLTGKPLQLIQAAEPRGTDGAVLGYPGGGPFTSVAAAVLSQISATGRDIYGQNITSRSVYEIQSDVRPGNSGGPLVLPDGNVIGVVFSASTNLPNVGFALTGNQVAPDVIKGEAATAAVSTQDCSG